MKKLYTLSAILITFLSFAQVPQGISYQAIALDASGNPVVSANVGIRLSILDTTATGAVLYSESHIKMTNPQGLFNLVIGQGTSLSGTFASVKWETNSKFLKVEMDASGGTNYVLVGTTELLSVPYALMAGKVKSEDVVGGQDEFGYSGSWYSSSFMTNTNAYVFSQASLLYDANVATTSVNSWHSIPISGVPFMKSQNSFLTSTNAYIFGCTDCSGFPGDHTNSWHSFPISGQPFKIISTNYNSTLVITSTNAYVYTNDSTGLMNWNPTSISGELLEVSSIGLGLLTSTNAYIFADNSWQTIAISGTPLKIKNIRQGMLVLTTTNAYLYGTDTTSLYGGSAMSWHNIPISGTLLLD